MRYSMLAGILALGLMSGAAMAAESFAGGAVMRSDAGYLTDANGMTLYSFDPDTDGVSTCYEQCAINWPPAIAEEGAAADGDFTLVARTDGTMQWAYKNMPLYLWKDDVAVGDTTGDGVGGKWHLVTE